MRHSVRQQSSKVMADPVGDSHVFENNKTQNELLTRILSARLFWRETKWTSCFIQWRDYSLTLQQHRSIKQIPTVVNSLTSILCFPIFAKLFEQGPGVIKIISLTYNIKQWMSMYEIYIYHQNNTLH